MKKSVLMFLAASVMGLYSCSDKLVDEENVGEHPQTDGITDGYVAFQINTIDTRAEGDDLQFDNGAPIESAINPTTGANIAFFFDKNKKFHSQSILNINSNGEDVSHDTHEKASSGYLEKYYKARIIKDQDETIESCILLLNVNADALSLLSSKLTANTTLKDFAVLTEIALKERNDFMAIQDKDGYFTMSNTVYINNENKLLQGPVNVEGKICSSMEEAENNKIQVHVERVASKFSITYDENDFTEGLLIVKDNENDFLSVHGGEKQKWGILIKGWDVNGTETASYLVKSLHDGSNFPMTTEEMTNTSFGKWSNVLTSNTLGWNDPVRLRSYWAVDPHYNDWTPSNYPHQYREALDVLDGSVTNYDDNDHSLNYIAFNAISIPEGNITYAPENTFGANNFFTTSDKSDYDFKGTDYIRTSTHILIAAELLIDDEVGSKVAADKYNYEGVYWKANEKNDLITYMAEAVILYESKKLYKEDKTEYNNATDALDYFELAPAKVRGGDGRVMIQLKDKKLYDADGNEVIFDATSPAVQAVGTAKHFKDGKMYYAIPIEHMVKPVDLANGETETKAHYYSVGSYGVVRNHWYKINISTIKQPGIPVDDPEQKIIPNDDPDNGAYASFEIVVIPWNVLQDQNVEL